MLHVEVQGMLELWQIIILIGVLISDSQSKNPRLDPLFALLEWCYTSLRYIASTEGRWISNTRLICGPSLASLQHKALCAHSTRHGSRIHQRFKKVFHRGHMRHLTCLDPTETRLDHHTIE